MKLSVTRYNSCSSFAGIRCKMSLKLPSVNPIHEDDVRRRNRINHTERVNGPKVTATSPDTPSAS